MTKIKPILERTMIGGIVVVQTLFFPAFALANEEAQTCPSGNGTSKPTGSSSHTYSFNPESCLWENQYYTWNPVTKVKSPRYSQEYVYNPETNKMERTMWTYSAAKGKYISYVQVKPEPKPEEPKAESNTNPESGSNHVDELNSGSNTGGTQKSTIDTTGPYSENSIESDSELNAALDYYNGIGVTNNISSYAGSGDASVIGNTLGGNATSGDADAVANILNMLQSSWDPTNGSIATFNADIYDHTGDLLLDPSAIINTGPNSSNNIDKDKNANLDINIQNDGKIVNNLDLTAESGDANVEYNTIGGDAKTGDATATANIFNLINSMISPVSSFIGTINIFGDLDGDILLPTLLSSIINTGPGSENSINNDSDTDVDITSYDNKSIANNTNLVAESGDATVKENTHGGNATTGNAETNLNVFNMTGQEVLGDRGLLVFTNVLGYWDGYLFDGPKGANSILGTGPGSIQAINSDTNTDIDIDTASDSAIENNINLTARSGNANVTGNTKGGNATTGNATATANIVNLINSQLDFSDWFGVLFINVFGDWFGSLGRDTEAGNSKSVSSDSKTSQSSKKSKDKSKNSKKRTVNVDGFNDQYGSGNYESGVTNLEDDKIKESASKIKNKKSNDNGEIYAAAVSDMQVSSETNSNPLVSWTVIGVVIGMSLLGAERWIVLKGNKNRQ